MNSFKQTGRPSRVMRGVLPALALTIAMLSPAWAATTTAEAFEKCREVAEVAYGSGDALADVRLDGVRKSGKQLKLRVFTPDGEQINASCNVNRKTGELVSIDPPGGAAVKKELVSRQ